MFPSRPTLVAACVLAAAGTAAAQVTVTLAAAKDNSIYADRVGNSNAVGVRLFTGNAGGLGTRRALIAFDLSSIPACATITAVQLNLTMAQTRSADLAVDLHRLVSDWGEGNSLAGGGIFPGTGGGAGTIATPNDATWNSRFHPGTAWSTAGGDFSATVSGSTVVGISGTFTWGSTGSMVADVQGWLDDPSTNFGWIVRTVESGISTARAFHSREASTAANQPSLVVTYTTAGVTASGAGCNGSGGSPYTATANGLPTVPNPNFAITLSGGPPVLAEGVLLTVDLLPVSLPFGSPGCLLHANPIPFQKLFLATAGTARIPIPRLRNPDCVTLAAQGIGLDANTNNFVLSNALTLTFGQ